MLKTLFILGTLTLLPFTAACDKGKEAGDTAGATKKTSKHPGTMAGAKALLGEFLKADADHMKLTMALKPGSADYKAAFKADAAAKAEPAYSALWKSLGDRPLAPKDGQTEMLLYSATTEELVAGKGDAGKFPGGYKRIADQLKPGVTWYRFKFVKPGEKLGMAFDGLTHVNGRWVIFPKPFRGLR